MASVFSWLDTSEGERRRALDVIDLFKERTTVDELGLGSVRDTIADIIAPGTSTIQTRARYFFFVPWIYLDLEKGKLDAARFAQRARQRELELIGPLSESPDPAGTFGIQSKAALRRLPSNAYWAGLRRLGFRVFDGPQDLYHRSWQRRGVSLDRDEAGDLVLGSTDTGNWNPHLSAKPPDFPDEASFDLTPNESQFFCDQIRMHAFDSLLHQLVEQDALPPEIAFPWQHPDIEAFPAKLRGWLRDAQCYAELMHGAQLLYNLMLAQERPLPDAEALFSQRFSQWAEEAGNDGGHLRGWERAGFWQRLRALNSRLPLSVEQFSEQWMTRVLSLPTFAAARNDDACRTLIGQREWRLKGARARLFSRSHLETWGGDSGSAKLNYRWPITRVLVNDILRGQAG